MTRILYIALFSLILALAGTTDVSAQAWGKGGKNGGSNDTRTLQLVGSPNVRLTLEHGMTNGEAQDQDDTTELVWGKGGSRSKITVSTFSPGQQFDLFVEATSVTNAKQAGRVQLRDGMQDQTLLVDVKKNKIGSARIVYTASSTIEDGSTEYGLSDVHTVTYTVTDM